MDLFDLILPPLYLAFILFVAHKYSANKLKDDETYRYFVPGLMVKMLGAVALGMVYFFYYGGGDTINYFNTAKALVKVMLDRPSDFNYLYFGKPFESEYYLFGADPGRVYWISDKYAFFAAKVFVPFVIICGGSYMTTALVVASACYAGIWRLYKVFVSEFPTLAKQFAIVILFVPSVTFWGSGIMKDSLTLTATCFYVHGFYWFFAKAKFRPVYIISIIGASFMLLSIKPYILFALLPGTSLWLVTLRIHRVKNAFLRLTIIPILFIFGAFIGYFLLQQLGDSLGQYSVDNVLKTASVSSNDLKQSYYGGNSFDIGDYDPSVAGMLSVSHKAIFAALFRPSLLDVRNVVMVMSALENTIVLLFCIYLLAKLRVFRFFTLTTSHPLLLFSFIFAIFFAFSVGVSISNFGTLVRLRIPGVPFFLASLIIIHELSKRSSSDYTSSAFISSSDHTTSQTSAGTIV